MKKIHKKEMRSKIKSGIKIILFFTPILIISILFNILISTVLPNDGIVTYYIRPVGTLSLATIVAICELYFIKWIKIIIQWIKKLL